MGINLMPAAYSPEIANRATSLEFELARPVDRGLVLATCLAALGERYRQLAGRSERRVISAWRDYASDTFGRAVEVAVGSRTVAGIVEDINDKGALLIRTTDQLLPVTSGQVTWK
jgi:biotin-(acetyl-CoA carboxylase) ligase